jgi:hypothetical protein
MYVCVIDVSAGGGGDTPPPDSQRRRRMFAGMKSLSVLGGRSDGGGESSSSRSISLPESRLLILLHHFHPLILETSFLKYNFISHLVVSKRYFTVTSVKET